MGNIWLDDNKPLSWTVKKLQSLKVDDARKIPKMQHIWLYGGTPEELSSRHKTFLESFRSVLPFSRYSRSNGNNLRGQTVHPSPAFRDP